MECIKDRYADNLNREVLVLRDENQILRNKLEELERRIAADRSMERSLDHENHVLKHDLSKVEMINRSMKIEQDHVMMDTELELVKLQKRLKQLEIDYEKVEQDKFNLSDQVTELQQTSKMIDIGLQDSQEIIARIQDDKLRLSQRIEKLTANGSDHLLAFPVYINRLIERALVLECERLKRREKGTKSRETVNQVEQYMRGIEIDRDYWKNEADLLREVQRKGARSPVHSQTQHSKPIPTNKSPKKEHSKDKQRIKELEKEKGELKIQVDSLRQENPISQPRNRSPSPNQRARSPTKDQKRGSEDIVQLKRERDDLRNLLNKLEKRVGEIQSNVKILTQEKDRFSQLYEDARKEIHHMHQDLLATQEDGGRATTQVKKLLNRVEMERDGLQTELARVQNERDTLLERYKATIDTANQDKYLLEQKIEDLQNTVRSHRVEKKDMTERLDSLRSRILDLEVELKNLEMGAQQNISELENEKEGSSQLKQQMQKLEMHLESAERQVAHLSSQLAKSEERGFMQEQKIVALTDDIRMQRDDFAHLRSEANRLDEDKDQLKTTLNEASQRLRQLESDLNAAEDELQESRDNLSMTEQQLGKVSEALASRENENRHIRKKADNVTGQVEENQKKITILSRDNDRLSENLNELQRLNKNIKHDLAKTIDERDELRSQVQTYVGEVKAAEELLADREEDQNKLLKRYQILSGDADLFRQKFEACQRDMLMCQQEILERENDLERCQNRVDELEKENTDRKLSCRELESRINHLSLIANQNRDQTKLIQHERDDLMSDLSALRDLCGRLEKSKEELEKELDSRNLDLEQMQANMDDLEHENESLREEIRSNKESIRSIETILSASRGQEQQSMAEIQEKNSDLSRIHDNLQMAEEKLQQNEREMQRLKNRNCDLEKDSERMQRCLTNEKFEKDRALSELRIHSLSPAYKPSCFITNGSHRSCSPCRACSPSYN